MTTADSQDSDAALLFVGRTDDHILGLAALGSGVVVVEPVDRSINP